MRLYLSGDSKNKVGYTPDFIIINGNHYDIQGAIDYDSETLNCRVKGDIFVAKEDDYYPLDEKEEEKLLNLLNSNDSKFSIVIYPVDDSEDEENFEKVKNDILINCEGEIFIKLLGQEISKKFVFETECYF